MDNYYMNTEMLTKGMNLKKTYERTMLPAYESLKTTFEELSTIENFNGKTKEGLIELFEILVIFHKNMNDKKMSYLAIFEKERNALIDFENSKYPKSVKKL